MNGTLAMDHFSPQPQRQRGVGLVEVLVAVLVLAVGMLGVAAMQAMALRNNQSAVGRSAAITQTYAILDVLRIDSARSTLGQYDIPAFACGVPDGGTFIQNELRNWVINTKKALGQYKRDLDFSDPTDPDADNTTCVRLVCNTIQCTVQIRWDDARGTAGSNTQTVTTVSRL